jgi:hypothetical protein
MSPPTQVIIWHAWRGSLRIATDEFPATMSSHEVRNAFCDRGLNDGTLRVTCPMPRVGMLATYQIGSDQYPYDVIRVSPSGSKLTLRARRARGPMTTEDPDGKQVIAHRDGAGNYRAGQALISLGGATAYLAPEF